MTQLVPMSIKGLMLDPVSNSPIVVLKDEEEKFFLPIWVGIFEANAILVGPAAVGLDGMRSSESGRAKQAASEARAFFIGPIDQPHGKRRTTVIFFCKLAKNFESRHHTERTIQPAAVGHRVEMASD